MRKFQIKRAFFVHRNYNTIDELKNTLEGKSRDELSKINFKIAQKYTLEKKYEDAKEFYLQSYKSLPKDDINNEITILVDLGMIYNQLKDVKNSYKFYTQFFSVASREKKYEFLNNTIIDYIKSIELSENYLDIDNIISKGVELNLDEKVIAEMYFWFGYIKNKVGDMALTKEYYLKSFNLSKKLKMVDLETRCSFHIGISEIFEKEAIPIFMANALKRAKSSKNNENIQMIENYIQKHSIQIQEDYYTFYELFQKALIEDSREEFKKSMYLADTNKKVSIFKPIIFYHYAKYLKNIDPELSEIYFLSGNFKCNEKSRLKYLFLEELRNIYISSNKTKKLEKIEKEMKEMKYLQ